MEKTLVLLKPDALRRRLVGQVISRFEQKGLAIRALKMMRISPALAKKHYAALLDRPYYPEIEKYITGGPILAMILEGDRAVGVVRTMIGATDGAEALPGTIRGDYSLSTRANIVHASDSTASAKREIALFFPSKKELFEIIY
ncbi:MAG: nucleoside-diphosphate kinase [Planctomycetia bacterium]|nr:nucleoside-diphosphate kinase [Planctomycetia bacterium]